jgi:plastocyanin domain-containing protein
VTWDAVLVNVAGLALIAFIVWFFWLVKARGVKAPVTTAGYQEQMVLVKGGYTPDVIVVERGKPVRLGKSAQLPEGQTVPVEFLPAEPGEYEFACQMGMFRGKVIVEP